MKEGIFSVHVERLRYSLKEQLEAESRYLKGKGPGHINKCHFHTLDLASLGDF